MSSSNSHRVRGTFANPRVFVSLWRPVALSCAIWLISAVGAQADGRDDAVRDRQFNHVAAIARDAGTARVIVELAVPNITQLSRTAIDAGTPQAAAQADQALSASIQAVREQTLNLLAGSAHRVNRVYNTIPFVALNVSEPALQKLRNSGLVRGIEEDTVERATLDGTVDIVGASTAWAKGFDGSGQYVAILDTGIRATHDMFAGKDIVEACFSSGQDGDAGNGGDCPNGSSSQKGAGSAAIHAGSPNSDHGTHVAGIATGNDPNEPLFGVARGADILAVQVFSQFFNTVDCDPNGAVAQDCVKSIVSDQVAALDWVFSERNNYTIASVNMSLGGGKYNDQTTCDTDQASRKAAIDNLRGAGIATVVASGNDGNCNGISTPACISSAIAVGSVDNSDTEAGSSNFDSNLLDLYAPGVSVRSATGGSDSSYGNKSGTSMATPHVAGAWAIMKEIDGAATVAAVLSDLQNNGASVTGRCQTPSQRRI